MNPFQVINQAVEKAAANPTAPGEQELGDAFACYTALAAAGLSSDADLPGLFALVFRDALFRSEAFRELLVLLALRDCLFRDEISDAEISDTLPGSPPSAWDELTTAKDVREALYQMARNSVLDVDDLVEHALEIGNPQVLLIHAYADLASAQYLLARAQLVATGSQEAPDPAPDGREALEPVIERVHREARATARIARNAAKATNGGDRR